VPKQLGELMSDEDPEKVGRVVRAFMQMKKFDIAKLQAAHDGKE
jgi:predicted 3-demethylubiquinone-9 3-methyltransferase (glyoxalase superfamily)